MNKKRKIGILDNSVGMTGALKAILNFAVYARRDFEFIFLLPKGRRSVEVVKKQGFKVIEIPFVEINRNLRNNLKYLPALLNNSLMLKRIIKNEDLSYIHINDFYNLVPILTKLFYNRFSIVTHIRFMPNRFPRLLIKCWLNLHLKFAEHIICVSNAVKSMLPDSDKVKVIYDSLIKRNDEVSVKQPNKHVINILYLSHFIKGKGQNFAIESFSKAYNKNKKLRMKMVGGVLDLEKNKEYKKSLISMVEEKGLEKVISFHSEVESSYKEMQEADIFLNFSESESFSMTCLEALSLGIPVIASNSGGPAELFVNGESGFLVPNRNIWEMAEAINLLANDSHLRTKFSINSVAYVNQKFSAANTFDKVMDLYKENFLDGTR